MYAHFSLKADREIVKIAICQNGCALEYVDDVFKSDIEVAKTAVKQNRYAYQFVSQSLKTHPEILNALKSH